MLLRSGTSSSAVKQVHSLKLRCTQYCPSCLANAVTFATDCRLSGAFTHAGCHAHAIPECFAYSHSVSRLHTVTACRAYIHSQLVMLTRSLSLSCLHAVTACHAYTQSQPVMLTHSHREGENVLPCICNFQQVTQEDCLACRAMRSIQWRIQIPLMTYMPVTGQYFFSHILHAWSRQPSGHAWSRRPSCMHGHVSHLCFG